MRDLPGQLEQSLRLIGVNFQACASVVTQLSCECHPQAIEPGIHDYPLGISRILAAD